MVQGDGAAESIIAAMDNIFSRIDEFDAVAIMRGGGSKSDLSCFDNYELAYYVAQFPLPILTGIGHERDDSVLDLVACVRLKTPTALAAFIIDRAAAFEQELTQKCDYVVESARQCIEQNIKRVDDDYHRFVMSVRAAIGHSQEQLSGLNLMANSAVRRYFDLQSAQLSTFEQKIRLLPQIGIAAGNTRIATLEQRLQTALTTFFEARQHQLDRLELVCRQADPQNVLQRGYSIVRSKGKAVTSPKQVQTGDELAIQMADGVIESVVK